MMQIHKQISKKAALIDPRNLTRNRLNLIKGTVSQGYSWSYSIKTYTKQLYVISYSESTCEEIDFLQLRIRLINFYFKMLHII